MSERAQRRLTTIVAADVAGYSRLIGADEEGTLSALRAHRSELIDHLIAEYGGRVANTAGDSLLLEFPSVVDAVRCSVAVQEGIAERNKEIAEDRRILFRVGINVGDVVAEGADLMGDGVNVAARLEGLAKPGGITLSDDAYRQIRDRLDFAWQDGGEHEVKNIARPIHTWHWPAEGLSENRIAAPGAEPPTVDKPSIAVLPFNNLSSDLEQEFFADGIVEDLITALSRFPWLFVIARNSSFSYKGRSVPIKEVAKDLGVSYVVEGSVRSSPSRLRVTVQLIDATSGHHIWAENYDRPTGDLFDLQDEITQSIVGVLVPALSTVERERSLRETRPKLDAWLTFQKGLAHYYRPYNDTDHAEARRLFNHAIELDEDFSDAYSLIAMMGVYALDSGQSSYSATAADIMNEAEQAANSAVQCGDNNALAHLALGRVYGRRLDFEAGIAECEIAVRLNPNLAIAHHELGFILVFAGRYREAVSCFDQAIVLSPNEPSRWNFYVMKGFALYGLESFEEAIVWLKEASRLRPTAFWPLLDTAACLAALGRTKEAQDAIVEALKRKPDLSMNFINGYVGKFTEPPPHLTSLAEHLAKAGLPR
jgi:adenylate cyclase